LQEKLAAYNSKVINMINKAWPANQSYKDLNLAYLASQLGSGWLDVFSSNNGIKTAIEGFKTELQKQKQ
jgi:hypothetical protein